MIQKLKQEPKDTTENFQTKLITAEAKATSLAQITNPEATSSSQTSIEIVDDQTGTLKPDTDRVTTQSYGSEKSTVGIMPEFVDEKHHDNEQNQNGCIFEGGLVSAASQNEVVDDKLVSQTGKNLNSIVTGVMLETTKQIGEEGWGKITQALKNEHSSVKILMGGKGLLFTFGMNLGSGYTAYPKKTSSDLIKDSLSATAADVVFSLGLSSATKQAAGPIGWGLFALEMVDSLLLTDRVRAGLQSQKDELISLAYRAEHPVMEDLYFEMADYKSEMLGTINAVHQMAEVSRTVWNFIDDSLRFCLDSAIESLATKPQSSISESMINSRPIDFTECYIHKPTSILEPELQIVPFKFRYNAKFLFFSQHASQNMQKRGVNQKTNKVTINLQISMFFQSDLSFD